MYHGERRPTRQLTVRPQAHHEAMQAARQRQETPEFKAQYALRSGVESRLSQGIRRFAVRQSRYRGLAGTHLQQLLTATAMNVMRVIAWLWDERWASADESQGTLPGWHRIPCHARPCCVRRRT